jgi:hypothetical protein
MTGNRFNRLPRASLFSPTTPTPVADRGASGRRQATKAEQAEIDAMPKLTGNDAMGTSMVRAKQIQSNQQRSVPRTFGFNTFENQPNFFNTQRDINQLKNDMNVLVAAVEQELLKMSHKIGEEDSISVTDQLAWFMNGD